MLADDNNEFHPESGSTIHRGAADTSRIFAEFLAPASPPTWFLRTNAARFNVPVNQPGVFMRKIKPTRL